MIQNKHTHLHPHTSDLIHHFFTQPLQAKHLFTGQDRGEKTNSSFLPELPLLQLIVHQFFTWRVTVEL